MANNFNVRIDLGDFSGATQDVVARAFPAVRAAVENVANKAAADWRVAVFNAKLWEGEKKPYLDSIKVEMVGPLKAEISSDYRLSQEIDEGRPAKDLKRMLQTSLKTRVSKKGEKYLIIPFEHGNPKATTMRPMPPAIFAAARTLMPSKVIGQTLRSSGSGAWDMKTRRPIMVSKAQYKWGDALEAGFAPKLQPHHHSDPYAGMVKMDTSTGKATRSRYLTFRIMTESSSGWIVPAKPGLHIVKDIARDLQPLAERAIGDAIAQSGR